MRRACGVRRAACAWRPAVCGLWFAAQGLVLFAGASFAQAAEQAKPFAAPQAADPAAPASASGLAQVTLSLVLVLAAVFAAAWVVRRLRGFGRFGAGTIEIIADVALGAKERAVLVQVGKQQLLLGVTPNQVNTLHVLTENVAVNSGQRPSDSIQSAPGAPPVALDFKAILKRSFGL
jgi:flagellar protein FliO/FliZ